MRHFWHGFEKQGSSPVQFKRHVVVLYWKAGEEVGDHARKQVKRLSSRFPSVKVKVINVEKDPRKAAQHGVLRFPTVLLLKDGREVDRIEKGDSAALLEHIFRKAHT